MKIKRYLDLPALLKKKSIFLFGPRSIGKSYLIGQQFKDPKVPKIDLLRSELYLKLAAAPESLENILAGGQQEFPKFAIIDEIQKIPILLDEVHRLIEKYRTHFLLTGSSARKLKRGAANLLGGRAWMQNIYPLTTNELSHFDLERFLRFGGLPPVILSDEPQEELHNYVKTYLTEEVQAEGLIRKIPNFARFLTFAALSNGQLLNYAELGSDAQLAPSTVREFYSILEDTLIGFSLHPWCKSKKRKAIQTAKFYLFDPGVTHALSGTKTLDRNSDLYGRSFEHFIGLELRAFLGYSRSFSELGFWRSTHLEEVDFTIGDEIAIEVKATKKLNPRDLRGLRALQEEKIFKKYIFVSQDPILQKIDDIQCLPWRPFLKALWDGTL